MEQCFVSRPPNRLIMLCFFSCIVRSNLPRIWRKSLSKKLVQGCLFSRLRSMSTAAVLNNMERTFQNQDKLPSLPVPPLAQTCEKYLDSVKPLLSREDFFHTEFLVNEFASGVGKDLQKKLEMRGKGMRNWLELWWEDVAYLRSRIPSAPLVNIGGPISVTDMWPAQEGTQIKRAAFLTYGMVLFWQSLYRQDRPIDRMGPVPLCMFQFSRLFSCCKIPGKEKDSLKRCFVPAPNGSPRHIIVQVNGRIFSCTVLDENLDPLSPPEIERQLQEIQSIVDFSPPGPGIGSLTGEERTAWHELRERILSLDRNNRKSLDVIETSLFALVLDETSPITDTEVCIESVLGNCRDRWFDKSLSLLVFKSGTLATHCDHAPFDGVVEINSVLSAVDIVKESGGEWKGSQDVRSNFHPHEVVLKTDHVISEAIERAVQQYNESAATVNLMVYRYDEYGKGFTKPHKIHPDTYVQLAIQLAYYRLHNKPAPTYETAQTRQFYHGRTDTVRSCTVEGVAWCRAMIDGNTENAKKLQLFREAQKKHDKLMKDASNGQGTDRHLLGLQLLAAEQGLPTPAIFLDKAWTASGGGGNFVLSTSCVGFTSILGGCAAMVKDGYGAFYSIEEDRINFVVASFATSDVTDKTKFQLGLRDSLREMRHMLLSAKL